MFEDIDPFTAPPAELLARVVDLEPGPLVQSVLLMVDPSTLCADDAITYLQVHERVTAWWASLQASALVAAASPERVVQEFALLDSRPGHDGERMIRIEDSIREEVAAAVRWSPATAQHRIDAARLLAGPLSATREALALGEISTGHVAVIVEAAGHVPEDHLAALQARVLPVARRGTLSMTRAGARRAVLSIDAEGERRRRLAARCTRSVYVVDELAGISTLIARMATEDAHAVMAAIDTRAHAIDDPTALIGEKRANALASLVLDGQIKGDSSRFAHLDIVIDLDSLLGLKDEPAELRGSGPITVEIVRELLADANVACTMRRLVTDPMTGHLLDVGRRTYQVPDRLRRFITTRDQTCRFPGCRRKAARCQVDHAIAWDDGGRGDSDNLGVLCVRHHQLKTHGGWDITESRDDGSCTWRSPHGRTYSHPPERVLRR